MSEQWTGGKGDRRRRGDQEIYDAGYNVAHAKTPKERAKWLAIWNELRFTKMFPGKDTDVTD